MRFQNNLVAMKKNKSEGFHSCGRYYEMGKTVKPYVEQIKDLLNEIRQNAINRKQLKKNTL